MKNTYLSLFLVFTAFTSGLAQQNLSGNIYTGWLFPYMDLTESDYIGYKPNLAVGAGIGYNFGSAFRLRGDVLYGSMNANNDSWYFQTTILEPQLGFDLNLIGLFSDYDGVKLNLQGGTGFSFYQANRFDRASGDRLAESPPRNEKPLSPNAFASYGANIGIKLSHKLDLNLGMTNRYIFDSDWIDGFEAGEAGDHYGFAQIGFVFYLKSDRQPGTVEVEEAKYQNLTAEADSAAALRESLADEQERIAELELQEQEQAQKNRKLMAELDSLQALTASNFDTISGKTTVSSIQPDQKTAATILSQEKYRIVVASLPTRQMAQRWIDRTTLDKSEMVIAYIENLNTHRVVYKSYDTYAAARKEQQQIKTRFTDAWIIKF